MPAGGTSTGARVRITRTVTSAIATALAHFPAVDAPIASGTHWNRKNDMCVRQWAWACCVMLYWAGGNLGWHDECSITHAPDASLITCVRQWACCIILCWAGDNMDWGDDCSIKHAPDAGLISYIRYSLLCNAIMGQGQPGLDELNLFNDTCSWCRLNDLMCWLGVVSPFWHLSPLYPALQIHCPVVGSHFPPLAQSHCLLQYAP